ncbi:hypothetical protein D3C80_1936890 [compost metagenome]
MGHAGRSTQALIGNRTHGREHVLDPVMQLCVDQVLQLVGGVALFRLNSGLNQ